MRCPVCPDVTLVMTERQGVEIDYCPTCRGVWLDRGELDKIVERATPVATAAGASEWGARDARHERGDREHDHDDDDDRGAHGGRRRRGGFLGDLFDLG